MEGRWEIMSDDAPREDLTFTKEIPEKWLYDALLYGKPTADFIAGVETAIKVLPEQDAC